MSRKPVKSARASERLPGFKIQPRDEHIIWFAGTNGYVTMPHIKLFAFEGRNEHGFWESVSEQAVYRRLKRLCDARLLEHQRTWYGDHGVYRATRAGLALVGLDLAPARLDKRDYEHDLRVVDLALDLTDYTCDGWITERQIKSRLRPGTSIGRVPDGLLIGLGGERWAVELEISGKEAQRYHDACDRYADRHRDRIPDDSPDRDLAEHLDDYIESEGEIDGVIWYFFSDKKRRRALAAAERVIADRNYDRYRTDHLHFRFHGANSPNPPPFDKWENQEENDLREAERLARERREEMERRERERRHAKAVAAAEEYLAPGEQAKAIEDAQNREYERGGWELTKEKRDEALIDAMIRKREREREKERRRQRTRETIRNLFGG